MNEPLADATRSETGGGARRSARIRWTERTGRARYLARLHPEAADLLTFYAALAEYQQSHAERFEAIIGGQPAIGPFPACLDTRVVLDAVPEMLSWLDRSSPAGLATSVIGMRRIGSSEWGALLERYLAGGEPDGEPAHLFVLGALLQPVVEQLAEQTAYPSADGREANRCPFCGRLPVAGVLREEGQGTKRMLVCGLCFTEWSYLRVVCPACDERTFDALPVYTAEQFPSVRIEACDTCRTYLKTLDASKDGLVIPLVDDVASVSMDLWAREQGYVRVRQNLLKT